MVPTKLQSSPIRQNGIHAADWLVVVLMQQQQCYFHEGFAVNLGTDVCF